MEIYLKNCVAKIIFKFILVKALINAVLTLTPIPKPIFKLPRSAFKENRPAIHQHLPHQRYTPVDRIKLHVGPIVRLPVR